MRYKVIATEFNEDRRETQTNSVTLKVQRFILDLENSSLLNELFKSKNLLCMVQLVVVLEAFNSIS